MNSGIKIIDHESYREACLCFEKKMSLVDISKKISVCRQSVSKWKVKWEIEGTPLKSTEGVEKIKDGIVITKEILSVDDQKEISFIRKSIPELLKHFIDRMLVLADSSDDLQKVAVSFEKVAPFFIPKVDDKKNSGEGESSRAKFYNNLFVQFNQPQNGQQDTITDIGHTEEPPTRE